MGAGSIFNPNRVQRREPLGSERATGADAFNDSVYVYYDERIALAVNVALATRRPLLLSGPSGCGKSTLAENVALSLGWRFYSHVVTSRTEATDFLYRFDSIRRLNDAHTPQALRPKSAYVEPGALWWSFDRASAERRGSEEGELFPTELAVDPCKDNTHERAAVLIDEIDKAEIDVPNALLVPLGAHRFKVEHTGITVQAERPPFIVITTNGERELPLAFMRRCVSLSLNRPDKDRLIEIARAHLPPGDEQDQLFDQVATYVLDMAREAKQNATMQPSTAEYLDTLRACLELNIGPGDPTFDELARITLRKQQDIEGIDR